MNIKRFMVFATVALAVATVVAAPKTTGKKGSKSAKAQEAEAEGPEARVKLDQFPKLGRSATLPAPALEGASALGRVYTKPRQWIVLEAKYTTYDMLVDQLTFEWHVLLETKTATTKDKEAMAKRAPYSYFSQTVTYVNIPKGSHAASVCLHPSYLEQYGEPKAVGIVIKDANGNVLEGECESEVKGIASHPKNLEEAFWNNNKVMDAKTETGDMMIERRQGLQDRSKTIWALVNPNDYELVIQ
jgi:hypothetical protein